YIPTAIGVIKDSYKIPRGADPWAYPHNDSVAQYYGQLGGWAGTVYYRGLKIIGNEGFASNINVRAEYDSEKGTLIYYNDEVQQPVFVSGINEKVRFIISLYCAESVCIIKQVRKLNVPTTDHVEDEHEIHW
ncbi:MAG: hypothetical protein EZS28_050721, partial [Streblomastix strix]